MDRMNRLETAGRAIRLAEDVQNSARKVLDLSGEGVTQIKVIPVFGSGTATAGIAATVGVLFNSVSDAQAELDLPAVKPSGTVLFFEVVINSPRTFWIPDANNHPTVVNRIDLRRYAGSELLDVWVEAW